MSFERDSSRFASRNQGRFAALQLLSVFVFLAVAACSDARQNTTTRTDTISLPVTSANSQGADSVPAPTDVPPSGADVSPASANAKSSAADASTAADVVRRYYDAINGGRYDSAYALWDGAGKASGKTRTGFASGFAQTKNATVTIGDSVSVEGAAGSQYATVPVSVAATQRNGRVQHFTGTYTLRRSMVDGATAAQRTWHIYSAKLKQR